ncbi:transposase, partial [Streptomyces sp. KR55]|uniref:transposase n=1 Tax=Streptomyces sp. KR55 TaxID=3457425 RepID=UPI003FD0BAC5
NRIHAVLAEHGLERPGACFTAAGRAWLEGLDLPDASRTVVDQPLAARARGDPRVAALTRLPGVGTFTALVIVTEVGDISRFPDARKLASWAGLTPTVRSSDLTVRHGRISKQGSAWLRWILCEAAQTAKRSPEFAGTCQAIAHRRGKKIATTAIARKLITRAYHVLQEADAEPRKRSR